MLRRNILEELDAYLRLMPATLLIGARQTGKTTIIETIAKERNIPLYIFDDEFVLSNAKRDPSGWLHSIPKPVIIDEVQRVPELFLPIKLDIDRNRNPGRYLLTGSANPLLLPELSDSLAGRMGILSLYPFSQGELHQIKEQFIPWIFSDSFEVRKINPFSLENLYEKIIRGGFPSVQSLESSDIDRWTRSYLKTIMERDVRDISNVEGLREFPRLFQLLATRTAQLLNIADLSRSLGMVHTTVNRYIRLLEILFFIHLLPAWFTNLGKRMTKAPKMHVCDTAILCTLLGVNSERFMEMPNLFGQFLETFVFSELLKQKQWSPFPVELFHFRDGDFEVDLILEKPDGTLVGIEIKSSRNLQADDWKGLMHLKKCAKQFKRGLILHPGTQIERIGDDLWAVPIQLLWG